jgi:tripartite-type tricarboxylate transporter receptor subunit TctC
VPKGTPLAVATRLRVELEKIGNSSDIRDHIGFSGVEFEVRSGNDFIDFIRAEQVKWGYLVKAAGIRTD